MLARRALYYLSHSSDLPIFICLYKQIFSVVVTVKILNALLSKIFNQELHLTILNTKLHIENLFSPMQVKDFH
jgi:hypothetical protein